MSSPKFPTIAKQVADHIREGLAGGRWRKTMPGRNVLAKELGVSRKTVESALKKLEDDGSLIGQGAGRPRRIAVPKDGIGVPAVRVALMVFDSPARGADYMIHLRHLLEDAGHAPFFPNKNLQDLGMDVNQVARYVKKIQADAWIVSAASQEILKWFSAQATPAFALFGRMTALPIAGVKPDKAPPIAAVTRQLLDLGHRRISALCRRQLRIPQPVKPLRAFLNELESAGIATGAFNLPDWKDSMAGFASVLDSLLGPTPPTALILDEAFLYHAAYHHLARRGLRVPEDVSLVCTDGDPTFAWCQPSVAHIHWDPQPVLRRILRWASNVSQGRHDLKQSVTRAEFIPGGTIGPAQGK